MPKYRYIVINQDNRQLQGTIGAPDVNSARQELNELGFSVIAIEETAPQGGEVVPTFEFAAIDKNQKRVVGTIQSPDRYGAYKRLIYEYEFQVEYVIDNGLPEAQKDAERKKGAFDLQTKLEEETMLTRKKETNEEKDLKEFEQQQDVLKAQIEFVLSKVKNMLDLYEKDMKPETKQKLRQYVEKILRIRSSTNLDYVRKSAEELLEFLQKEELFLYEDTKTKERTKMVVEAKSMMMQLRRGKTKKGLSITDELRKWRMDNIVNNPAPSGLNKFLDIFVSFLIGANRETPEIIGIKKDIAVINDQIWQYISLYFQSPSPEFKHETKEGLKRLWAEKKRLKKLLHDTERKVVDTQRASGVITGLEKLTHEIVSFTGWLLTFYLIYYFISIYAVSKDLGTVEIPGMFYIFRSGFLKYFLTTLFLLHGAMSVKINFFRKSEAATLIIAPTFLLSSLLIYLNF